MPSQQQKANSAAETLVKDVVHTFDAIARSARANALVGRAMLAKGNAATTERRAQSTEL